MKLYRHCFIKLIFALAPLLFIGFAASPKQLYAQDTSTLTIVPPKFELFANPGDVITETIRVRNDSPTPQSYGILIEDFSSAGEEGRVVLEEGENDSQFSLKKWIEPSSKNLTIQPAEEVVFPFTIAIPKDAEPGGHYASILFQIGGGGEANEGVTSVQHRVGSLILLRISGNVVEEAQIETFQAPVYSKSGPVIFNLRIKNNGTTHIRPNGTIVITNVFGKKVDELPLNGLNVFPGAIRKMETTWDKKSLLGHYTATLVATYGQQNLPLTAASKFTVISPVAAVIIVVAIISGILFILSAIQGKSRLLKALKVIITGS